MDALLPLIIIKAIVEVALGFLLARGLLAVVLAMMSAGGSNAMSRFLALGTRPLEALLCHLCGTRVPPRLVPWLAAVMLLAVWMLVTSLKIGHCRTLPDAEACTTAFAGKAR